MHKQGLIDFEEDIRQEFIEAHIRAPVHLSKGNERQLIEIFKLIKPDDWVFSTHRSHYHALLKGIPEEWVKEQILNGDSMHLMNPEHRFFASAIVGGCIPIAVGVALAIKRNQGTENVWVFTGDMASETGIFFECAKYSRRNNLPITFVIEDNGKSTNTPTQEIWGLEKGRNNVIAYKYEMLCPHINVDQFVEFH